MIKRILASNYRSLARGVRLELGPLTALAGPNGSGKSNIVDVLRFVSDCVHLGLEGAVGKRHGIAAVRRWSSGRPFNLSIRLEIESASFSAIYAFTLRGAAAAEYHVESEEASINGSGRKHTFKRENNEWRKAPQDLRPRLDSLNLALPLIAGDERFRPLADYLRKIMVYSVFPDILREPQKYDPSKPMYEHGANWLSILKDPGAKDWKNDLVAALGKLTGDVEDIEIRPAGGYLIARFKHHGNGGRGKWFDAAQEADGTLRVAGIITALLQDAALRVIGLEEPELTVHPRALPLVCDYIKEAADRSQVILTTHSPDLLDQLDVDQVRVVERHNGATSVAPLDGNQRELVRAHVLTLGEVFRTEGLKQLTLPAE
ncbi:MAG: AAA family ATPase [bacterium]|nr:AAA family ATPase [bacterium]